MRAKEKVTMRLASILLALCCCVRIAAADERRISVPAALLSGDMAPEVRARLLADADHDERSGRSMMAAGIVLTTLGTVLTIAGPLLLMHGAGCENNCRDSEIFGSIAMSTIGPLAMVSGIPLWAVGQARNRRGERARVVLTPGGVRF
jgi:hypothetical protein